MMNASHGRLMSALLGAAALLSACAQPEPPIVLQGVQSTPQDPAVSRLANTCAGYDRSNGWHVRGTTMQIVRVDVQEIINGYPAPFTTFAGVADNAWSAVTRPVFLNGANGAASCAGSSLETILHGSREVLGGNPGRTLEWRMEFSPGPGRPPADVVQVRGETPISAQGTATQRVPFLAMGRQFVADFTVTPGPAWHAEQTRARARAADALSPSPFSRQMPDEQPFRTLDDVTRRTGN